MIFRHSFDRKFGRVHGRQIVKLTPTPHHRPHRPNPAPSCPAASAPAHHHQTHRPTPSTPPAAQPTPCQPSQQTPTPQHPDQKPAIGAAGADVVGRRQAPRRRTQGTHKVGGLVDERRDGRDSGAHGPVSAMAKPPPDLATATGNATSAVESKPGAQVQQQRFRSPTQSPRTPRC